MKRLLTYGLLLLTILAGHFVVSACQDDLPETTEVMMTFTTRAVVTQDKESEAIDVEKMKNLRVIMVREDGTIAYKEVNEISGSSVTVTFNTPVKTGGENFRFFAIANEDGILPAQNLGNIQSADIEPLKTRVVGSGSEFSISNAIPQTKYWTAKVNPYESLSVSQQLDYLVGKVSVQFKNETNKAQSLSNIHITGITPNGKARLFNHPTGEKDNEGNEIYDEVYVTTNDVALNNGIGFNTVTDLPSGESSAIQHYYTYPVDNGNISSPTLHATWNGKNYTLPLEGIKELKRNDHLKIVVTLTGQELIVNYTIAPWTEHATNIGSPTTGGGYQVDGWGNGNDIIIGGEIGGGDTPGGGEDPNPDPEEPDDVIELWNNDEGDFVLNNTGQNIQIDNIYVDYITAGKTLTFYYTFVPNAQWYKIEFQCNGNKIIETTLQYSSEASSQSVQLTDETAGWLKSAIDLNQLKFYGMGISITSICLE